MYLMEALSSQLPSGESNLKGNEAIACFSSKTFHKYLSVKGHGDYPEGEKKFFISKTGILKEKEVEVGL